MFEITDIMKTDVITVKKGTPIYEAMERLVEHNFTGLPVVDDKYGAGGHCYGKRHAEAYCGPGYTEAGV